METILQHADAPLYRAKKTGRNVENDAMPIGSSSCGTTMCDASTRLQKARRAGAVKKARELSPDLIILDFAMPRMNGLAAARQICKSNPKCLMLMLTTFLSQPLIEEARAAGIRAAVAKSEVSRLLPEIQSVIRTNERC